MPKVNRDLTATPGSGIREIMNRVFSRPGAIRLEVGEPSFPTPAFIREAAIRALEEGRTRYTPTAGLPQLREALQAKVERVNGVERPVDGLMVTPGAGSAIFLALRGLMEPGDGVLVPDPGWTNYLSACRALGLRLVPYPLEPPDFVPDLGEMARRVDAGVRAVLVNFPSNPTGSVPDAAWMEGLARLARDRDLWIVSDEVYDQLVFEGQAVSPARLAPERTVAVYSFSKTYAMTGWRLGYVAAAPEVTAYLTRLAEQIWQCVNEPTQWAGLAALQGDQTVVEDMREAYRQRRDLALQVAQAQGLRTFRPRGAFYLMVDVGSYGEDSRQFALDLLEREGVAVVPGTAFGEQARHLVRLSLAASEADIQEGLARLARRLQEGPATQDAQGSVAAREVPGP